ncbi:TPA: hypothetical protein ACGJWV_005988, partial [Pseudomonas aeruginosa]
FPGVSRPASGSAVGRFRASPREGSAPHLQWLQIAEGALHIAPLLVLGLVRTCHSRTRNTDIAYGRRLSEGYASFLGRISRKYKNAIFQAIVSACHGTLFSNFLLLWLVRFVFHRFHKCLRIRFSGAVSSVFVVSLRGEKIVVLLY